MLHARLTFLATTLLAASALAQKGDPFAEGVRTTEPLTPADQRAKFKLPPGFEIQLVAAEPELRKPMNMAFDATGRLWVTESREYPFPAKEGAEKRDSIRIFSDFGPDGRARRMEIFADGLNIPIGLYPFRTENGNWKCIAWSIPNIWLFEDTDGDGKADKREVLFGPLGWERDTHGNQASFRRGDDGWIYATHGFNNHSTFKAKDGSTITLQSGNTYRFRPDGSRIEQWTWGQVNPYGLCWDDRGNLFSADCHSSPIYQLLRGGEYPSFGKPDTGLGFAPQTIQHSHGSTAICGPMLIRDPAWPAELQGHMLVGNVMTSRLNHDLIEWHGSSSKGKELPDFLTSEDPWFRPVDLQWGPDGALYIADFYNRIIGHYEVPLLHPGRDRERGRIWRVVYKGDAAAAKGTSGEAPAFGVRGLDPALDSTGKEVALQKSSAGNTAPDSPKTSNAAAAESESGVKPPHSKASRPALAALPKSIAVAPDASLPREEEIAALVKELGSSNPMRRSLALNEICDRVNLTGNELERLVGVGTTPFQTVNLQWLQNRMAIQTFSKTDAARDSKLVLTQMLRMMSESFVKLESAVKSHHEMEGPRRMLAMADEFVRGRLADDDAIVRRVAAEVLATRPTPENFTPLLTLLRTTDKADDHLIYSTRVALREHLRDPEVARQLKLDGLSREDLQVVLDIMPAVPSEHAALLRFDLFTKLDVEPVELAKQLPSIIKNAPAARLNDIATLARRKLAGDYRALSAVITAHDQRGVAPGRVVEEWAAEMVPQLLAGRTVAWTFSGGDKDPWALQERKSADGESTRVMSSIVGGEKLTGILGSAPFAAPWKLRFYLCGHDGVPGNPAGKKNHVRLVDAADGKTLREAVPPRDDVAQRIEWDLADLNGRQVRFEATDGDSADAYAWLAFGRFKPELPELTLGNGGRAAGAIAADLAARFMLSDQRDALLALFNDRSVDTDSRAAAARSLIEFYRNGALGNPTGLGVRGIDPALDSTGKDEAPQKVPAGKTAPESTKPLNAASAENQSGVKPPHSKASRHALDAIAKALASADEPDALREKVAVALGSVASPSVCQLVADAMPSASSRLQQSFAAALSANRCGTIVLIAAVEAGKATPHVLRDKATVDRLRASAKGDELKRLAVLLAKLPPANIEADKRIASRRAAFDPAKADAAKGAEIFKTQCAACHQIGQVGSLIGPQLDGVGSRGIDRILEDVLDPNRNVDRAFRMSIVTMNDGSITAGLFRREEGAQLVLADVTGKELTVPAASVKSREEQETSLMPPAFGDVIPQQDFDNLLAYLLAQKATK